uniref:Uncharacterized protein n=1 Tax=Arundo donax TaxID=35708 RepID=A0A0A8YQS0_ARUDO
MSKIYVVFAKLDAMVVYLTLVLVYIHYALHKCVLGKL